jgi:hypothetical protein
MFLSGSVARPTPVGSRDFASPAHAGCAVSARFLWLSAGTGRSGGPYPVPKGTTVAAAWALPAAATSNPADTAAKATTDTPP